MVELGKKIGDKVKVHLYKDESERTIEIHPLLIQEFNRDKALRENYEKLSFIRKKELLNQVTSAKKEETLKSRLEIIITDLKKK